MELPALTTRVLAVVGLRVARQSVRTSFSLILFVFLILGPGKDMFDSTRIIGQNQFDFAYNLFNTAKVKLAAGNTSAVHAFVDFFNVTVSPKYSGLGVSASTCPAAIGDAYFNPFSSLFTNRVSTAAGTIDGAGDFDFHQVSFSHSWLDPFSFPCFFLSYLCEREQIAQMWTPFGIWLAVSCTSPPKKSCSVTTRNPFSSLLVVFGTFLSNSLSLFSLHVACRPPWFPTSSPSNSLELVICSSSLFLLSSPPCLVVAWGYSSSQTALSHPQNTVRETLIANGAPSNTIVVIAGLANEYTQYVATPEEYRAQSYFRFDGSLS